MALDILIKNGLILDGLGTPAYQADLAVKNGRIEKIGFLGNPSAVHHINAAGYYVAPGFIDINNASDRHWSLFDHPKMESYLHQGVTTVIGGNCGASFAPLVRGDIIASVQKYARLEKINVNWHKTKEFLSEVKRKKLILNFATLTGHSTLRRDIIGDQYRDLTEKEIAQAQYLLEKSLEEGALGFSTGLSYSHEKVAASSEIKKFADIAAKHKKIYSSHLRDEGDGLVSSVKEAIEIARSSGANLEICHLKAQGKGNQPLFETALEMIEGAASQGININFDMYPYAATATTLHILLPDWVLKGGRAQIISNLSSQETRKQIMTQMKDKEDEMAEIVIASGMIDKAFIGKTLGRIARNQNTSIAGALINILIAGEGRVIGFWPILSEENIEKGLKSPLAIIASDGAAYSINDARGGYLAHPRSFGAFARIFRRYVKERKILSWEEAVKKMTALPTLKFGLKNRGVLRPGFIADITIFNPEIVRDLATFENPFQYASGFDAVIVGGKLALSSGKIQEGVFGEVIQA